MSDWYRSMQWAADDGSSAGGKPTPTLVLNPGDTGKDDDDDDTDDDKPTGPTQADIDKLKEALRKERSANKELLKKVAAPANDAEADKQRKQIEEEVTAKANRRILNSEVKALAAGVLANPALAPRLLNLEDYELDSEGNAPEADIKRDLAALISENPGLASGAPPKKKSGTDMRGASNGKPDMNAMIRKLGGYSN